MSTKFLSLAFPFVVLLLPVAGCGTQRATERPDLVLVVIDTLRADHLGAYGYGRPTSPTLDAIAREGTLFTNADSTSSWTRPAMASLFTGRLPSVSGIAASTDRVDPDLPTVAERLRAAGYRTVGVTGNFVHVNAESGLSAGFDHFDPVSMRSSEGSDVFFEIEGTPVRAPTAVEMNQRVFQTLDRLDDPAGPPLFLYVHYMDPHSGYMAPERFRRRFGAQRTGPPASSDYVVEVASGRIPVDAAERARLMDLYDAEIAAVDDAIGDLLAGLAARGVARPGVFFFVSDHGEEFADHGGWFHGFTLYREQLHVPLIVRDLRSPAAGARREEAVDLTDVAATLLALGGVEEAADAPGRNLLAAAPWVSRPRVAELEHDALREKRVVPIRHRRAVTEWPWKALVDSHGEVSVHQLERDPNEAAPGSLEDAGVPRSLREAARQLAVQAAVRRSAPPAPITPEEREGLRALGYAE